MMTSTSYSGGAVSQDAGDLTSQLNAARSGDRDAAASALTQVYLEMKQIARGVLRGNPLTLNPTSLVHDAFLKLMPESNGVFADRQHFFKLAARAMRQIVVDQARSKAADKRGGQWVRTDLSEQLPSGDDDRFDLVALDAALTRLQSRDSELADIVEAYFFAGFTFDEIAQFRDTSERSVRRQWEVARLFLMKELDAA
jgi:RNA polymerase sigma factor (TIGR02999 family)